MGYTKAEIAALLTAAPNLLNLEPGTIIKKHAQLAALLQATPADVRAFAINQPTSLCFNLSSSDVQDRVQLWLQETGRPIQSLLIVPMLLQRSLGRTAARMCYLSVHNRTLTPSARELFESFVKFSQRVQTTKAEYGVWRQQWLKTPKGRRYGTHIFQ